MFPPIENSDIAADGLSLAIQAARLVASGWYAATPSPATITHTSAAG